MDNIIRNCFIARIISVFACAFDGSIFGKLKRFILKCYSSFVTNRLFVAFFSQTPKSVYSKLYAYLLKFNTALKTFGDLLLPIVKESFVSNSLHILASGSLIVNFFNNLGAKRFLIVIFALFLPVDVLIRDCIKIDFFSSIWDEAFMLLCIGFILYRIITSKKVIKPRITPVDMPLLFFMCIGILLIAVVSPKLKTAIDGYRAVFQFMLWFFVLTRLIEDDNDFKTFYFTLSELAVVIALHGIYQYITKAPMPAHWVSQSEVGVRTRVYSIIGSPNIMGAFMVMTAPMLAALAYYSKKLWVKCLLWGGTGIICLATLFTFSRGAWFGLTVAVIIFSLLVDRNLLIVAGVAIIAVVFCVPEITNRIAFLFTADFAKANSTGGRGQRWQIGLELLRQNPLFGFGLGRYGGAVAMHNMDVPGLNYYYMDNYYMKTLTEMGLIGLLSYVWLLFRNLIWSCRSLFKTKHNKMSILSAGIISGQLGVLTHSFFENIFEVPYMNAYFWGLSAIVMYLGYTRRRSNDI